MTFDISLLTQTGFHQRAGRYCKHLLLTLTLLFVCITSAKASLCSSDKIKDVHRTEVLEMETQNYNTLAYSTCPSGAGICYQGLQGFNEQILACNRQRDSDRASPVNRKPGSKLDRRSETDRQFDADLPVRAVKGKYKYLGAFKKWYGYLLERNSNNWRLTTILDFSFPRGRNGNLHLPLYLAQRLSLTSGGPSLLNDVCSSVVSGGGNGRIDITKKDDTGNNLTFTRACRIKRNTELFPLSLSDTYLPTSASLDVSQRADEWLMRHWRKVIERSWSRLDNSFEVKVEIANFVGRPGEITSEQLRLYEQNNVVYQVELHHRQNRLRDMYRPIDFRPLGLFRIRFWKAIYAGTLPYTIAHEWGHSIGLGDDYAEKNKPKEEKDCEVISGVGSLNMEHANRYFMCHSLNLPQVDLPLTQGVIESYNYPINTTHAKSIYLWIATQRYSSGKLFKKCKTNGYCPDGHYCRKNPVPTIANRCEPYHAEGARCSSDKQCGPEAFCRNKPIGSCSVAAAAIGEACTRNSDCQTNKCNGDICVCKYDHECPSSEYCDKGVVIGLGNNNCRVKRDQGSACSRHSQCQSGCCKLRPTGKRCRPSNKCF